MNPINQEHVILVDHNDHQIGTMEKMEAHRQGVLHRAFSVFLFNDNGDLLLQQRALSKYHSAGLWTNTCCSHPRPGESTGDAAFRRLKEEMGITAPLEKAFSFIYKVRFDNDLFEHELDHILIGTFNGIPEVNPEEVNAYKWVSPIEIRKRIESNPEEYTAWFKICFEEMFDHYREHIQNKQAS